MDRFGRPPSEDDDVVMGVSDDRAIVDVQDEAVAGEDDVELIAVSHDDDELEEGAVAGPKIGDQNLDRVDGDGQGARGARGGGDEGDGADQDEDGDEEMSAAPQRQGSMDGVERKPSGGPVREMEVEVVIDVAAEGGGHGGGGGGMGRDGADDDGAGGGGDDDGARGGGDGHGARDGADADGADAVGADDPAVDALDLLDDSDQAPPNLPPRPGAFRLKDLVDDAFRAYTATQSIGYWWERVVTIVYEWRKECEEQRVPAAEMQEQVTIALPAFAAARLAFSSRRLKLGQLAALHLAFLAANLLDTSSAEYRKACFVVDELLLRINENFPKRVLERQFDSATRPDAVTINFAEDLTAFAADFLAAPGCSLQARMRSAIASLRLLQSIELKVGKYNRKKVYTTSVANLKATLRLFLGSTPDNVVQVMAAVCQVHSIKVAELTKYLKVTPLLSPDDGVHIVAQDNVVARIAAAMTEHPFFSDVQNATARLNFGRALGDCMKDLVLDNLLTSTAEAARAWGRATELYRQQRGDYHSYYLKTLLLALKKRCLQATSATAFPRVTNFRDGYVSALEDAASTPEIDRTFIDSLIKPIYNDSEDMRPTLFKDLAGLEWIPVPQLLQFLAPGPRTVPLRLRKWMLPISSLLRNRPELIDEPDLSTALYALLKHCSKASDYALEAKRHKVEAGDCHPQPIFVAELLHTLEHASWASLVGLPRSDDIQALVQGMLHVHEPLQAGDPGLWERFRSTFSGPPEFKQCAVYLDQLLILIQTGQLARVQCSFKEGLFQTSGLYVSAVHGLVHGLERLLHHSGAKDTPRPASILRALAEIRSPSIRRLAATEIARAASPSIERPQPTALLPILMTSPLMGSLDDESRRKISSVQSHLRNSVLSWFPPTRTTRDSTVSIADLERLGVNLQTRQYYYSPALRIHDLQLTVGLDAFSGRIEPDTESNVRWIKRVLRSFDGLVVELTEHLAQFAIVRRKCDYRIDGSELFVTELEPALRAPTTIPLAELNRICLAAENFLAPFVEHMRTMKFFAENRSELFDSFLQAKIRQCAAATSPAITNHALARAVQQAVGAVAALFQPEKLLLQHVEEYLRRASRTNLEDEVLLIGSCAWIPGIGKQKQKKLKKLASRIAGAAQYREQLDLCASIPTLYQVLDAHSVAQATHAECTDLKECTDSQLNRFGTLHLADLDGCRSEINDLLGPISMADVSVLNVFSALSKAGTFLAFVCDKGMLSKDKAQWVDFMIQPRQGLEKRDLLMHVLPQFAQAHSLLLAALAEAPLSNPPISPLHAALEAMQEAVGKTADGGEIERLINNVEKAMDRIENAFDGLARGSSASTLDLIQRVLEDGVVVRLDSAAPDGFTVALGLPGAEDDDANPEDEGKQEEVDDDNVSTTVACDLRRRELVNLARGMAFVDADVVASLPGRDKGDLDLLMHLIESLVALDAAVVHLRELGHPSYAQSQRFTQEWSRADYTSLADFVTAMAVALLDLRTQADEWVSTLQEQREQSDELLLFCMPTLLRLRNLLFTGADAHELFDLLVPFLEFKSYKKAVATEWEPKLSEMIDYVEALKADLTSSDPRAVLRALARFLGTRIQAHEHPPPPPRITDHGDVFSPVTYEHAHLPDGTPHQLLRLLLQLTDGVLDQSRQLWCTEQTTEEELSLFLERAIRFEGVFVLLRVGRLSQILQRHILRWQQRIISTDWRSRLPKLPDSVVYILDINRTPQARTLMRTDFAGASERTYDPRALPPLSQLEPHPAFSKIVSVVGAPSDGKSFFIHRKLHKESPTGEFATVSFHDDERQLVADVIKQLTAVRDQGVTHVHFDISGYAHKELINETLLQLFVFGRIESQAGTVFCMRPEAPWTVYVEVPSFRSTAPFAMGAVKIYARDVVGPVTADEVDDGTALTPEMASTYVCDDVGLPALATVGEICIADHASNPLVVDISDPSSEMSLALSYMLAFEDGTIDMIRPDFQPFGCATVGAASYRVKWGEIADRMLLGDLEGRITRLLQSVRDTVGMPRDWSLASRLQQVNFLRFIGRCASVLDNLPHFTMNEIHPTLGRTFFENMLCESLAYVGGQLWTAPHVQIVFCPPSRHSNDQAVSYAVHSPDQLGDKGDKFKIDMNVRLDEMRTGQVEHLYRILAAAFGFKYETSVKHLIEGQNYILTADYASKLISVNERRLVRVSTVCEGETGVGKTALLRIFSLLVNAPHNELLFVRVETEVHQAISESSHLAKLYELQVVTVFVDPDEPGTVLANAIIDLYVRLKAVEPEQLSETDSRARDTLRMLLLDVVPALAKILTSNKRLDAGAFEALHDDDETARVAAIDKIIGDEDSSIALLRTLLQRKGTSRFHRLGVHGALTRAEVEEFVEPIFMNALELARLAQQRGDPVPTLTIFFDELNTSNCLSIFEELMVNRRYGLRSVPENVFFVAAINPLRDYKEVLEAERSLQLNFDEDEDGTDNAAAALQRNVAAAGILDTDGRDTKFYFVRDIPASLNALRWVFGSMSDDDMHTYLEQKLQFRARECLPEGDIQSFERLRPSFGALEALIIEAHRFVRNTLGESAVSQRDFQRVVTVWSFFYFSSDEQPGWADLCETCSCKVCREWLECYHKRRAGPLKCMLAAIGVTYYLRLNPADRQELDVHLMDYMSTRSVYKQCLIPVSQAVMDAGQLAVNEFHLDVPAGIARTDSLRENVLAMVVCIVNRIPLLIIGKPGSSKTLSFHITMAALQDGARTTKKHRFSFFAPLSRFTPLRYQGSHATTSVEIDDLFVRAEQLQMSVNGHLSRGCAILFDEIGLTDRDRQPLKALHHHLDSPLVSFVAISNRLLDPARMNRCVIVRRAAPIVDDLVVVAKGIIARRFGMFADEVVPCICRAYDRVSRERYSFGSREFSVFGLRDLYAVLRDIDTHLDDNGLNDELLVGALARNFYAVTREDFMRIASIFFEELKRPLPDLDSMSALRALEHSFSDPLAVTVGKLGEVSTRFAMLIDDSEDESVSKCVVHTLAQAPTVLYFSQFEADRSPTYESDLISRFVLAMERGGTVVLMHTESIHDALYDAFNQMFHAIELLDRKLRFFTTVAIGSLSRSVQVHKDFQAVVHIAAKDVPQTDAPFLNRFAKFRVDVHSILSSRLAGLSSGLRRDLESVYDSLMELVQALGPSQFYGLSSGDEGKSTVASIVLSLLPSPGADDRELSVPTLAACFAEGLPSPHTASRHDYLLSRSAVRLLQLAFPEAVFRWRSKIDPEIFHAYCYKIMVPSLADMISTLEAGPSPDSASMPSIKVTPTQKLIVFTRSTSLLASVRGSEATALGLSPDTVRVVQFDDLRTEREASRLLGSFVSEHDTGGTQSTLLVLVNMSKARVHAVNHLRMLVDDAVDARNADDGAGPLRIVLVLHFSPINQRVRSCYTPLFLHEWDCLFVESVVPRSELGAHLVDVRMVLRDIASAAVRSSEARPAESVDDVLRASTKRLLDECLHSALNSLNHDAASLGTLVRGLKQLFTSEKIGLWPRVYRSFEHMWQSSGSLVESLLDRASERMLRDATTQNTLAEAVTEFFRSRFVDFLVVMSHGVLVGTTSTSHDLEPGPAELRTRFSVLDCLAEVENRVEFARLVEFHVSHNVLAHPPLLTDVAAEAQRIREEYDLRSKAHVARRGRPPTPTRRRNQDEELFPYFAAVWAKLDSAWELSRRQTQDGDTVTSDMLEARLAAAQPGLVEVLTEVANPWFFKHVVNLACDAPVLKALLRKFLIERRGGVCDWFCVVSHEEQTLRFFDQVFTSCRALTDTRRATDWMTDVVFSGEGGLERVCESVLTAVLDKALEDCLAEANVQRLKLWSDAVGMLELRREPEMDVLASMPRLQRLLVFQLVQRLGDSPEGVQMVKRVQGGLVKRPRPPDDPVKYFLRACQRARLEPTEETLRALSVLDDVVALLWDRKQTHTSPALLQLLLRPHATLAEFVPGMQPGMELPDHILLLRFEQRAHLLSHALFVAGELRDDMLARVVELCDAADPNEIGGLQALVRHAVVLSTRGSELPIVDRLVEAQRAHEELEAAGEGGVAVQIALTRYEALRDVAVVDLAIQLGSPDGEWPDEVPDSVRTALASEGADAVFFAAIQTRYGAAHCKPFLLQHAEELSALAPWVDRWRDAFSDRPFVTHLLTWQLDPQVQDEENLGEFQVERREMTERYAALRARLLPMFSAGADADPAELTRELSAALVEMRDQLFRGTEALSRELRMFLVQQFYFEVMDKIPDRGHPVARALVAVVGANPGGVFGGADEQQVFRCLVDRAARDVRFYDPQCGACTSVRQGAAQRRDVNAAEVGDEDSHPLDVLLDGRPVAGRDIDDDLSSQVRPLFIQALAISMGLGAQHSHLWDYMVMPGAAMIGGYGVASSTVGGRHYDCNAQFHPDGHQITSSTGVLRQDVQRYACLFATYTSFSVALMAFPRTHGNIHGPIMLPNQVIRSYIGGFVRSMYLHSRRVANFASLDEQRGFLCLSLESAFYRANRRAPQGMHFRNAGSAAAYETEVWLEAHAAAVRDRAQFLRMMRKECESGRELAQQLNECTVAEELSRLADPVTGLRTTVSTAANAGEANDRHARALQVLAFYLDNAEKLEHVSRLPVYLKFLRHLRETFEFRISEKMADLSMRELLSKYRTSHEMEAEMLEAFFMEKVVPAYNAHLDFFGVYGECQGGGEVALDEISEHAQVRYFLPTGHDEDNCLYIAINNLTKLQNQLLEGLNLVGEVHLGQLGPQHLLQLVPDFDGRVLFHQLQTEPSEFAIERLASLVEVHTLLGAAQVRDLSSMFTNFQFASEVEDARAEQDNAENNGAADSLSDLFVRLAAMSDYQRRLEALPFECNEPLAPHERELLLPTPLELDSVVALVNELVMRARRGEVAMLAPEMRMDEFVTNLGLNAGSNVLLSRVQTESVLGRLCLGQVGTVLEQLVAASRDSIDGQYEQYDALVKQGLTATAVSAFQQYVESAKRRGSGKEVHDQLVQLLDGFADLLPHVRDGFAAEQTLFSKQLGLSLREWLGYVAVDDQVLEVVPEEVLSSQAVEMHKLVRRTLAALKAVLREKRVAVDGRVGSAQDAWKLPAGEDEGEDEGKADEEDEDDDDELKEEEDSDPEFEVVARPSWRGAAHATGRGVIPCVEWATRVDATASLGYFARVSMEEEATHLTADSVSATMVNIDPEYAPDFANELLSNFPLSLYERCGVDGVQRVAYEVVEEAGQDSVTNSLHSLVRALQNMMATVLPLGVADAARVMDVSQVRVSRWRTLTRFVWPFVVASPQVADQLAHQMDNVRQQLALNGEARLWEASGCITGKAFCMPGVPPEWAREVQQVDRDKLEVSYLWMGCFDQGGMPVRPAPHRTVRDENTLLALRASLIPRFGGVDGEVYELAEGLSGVGAGVLGGDHDGGGEEEEEEEEEEFVLVDSGSEEFVVVPEVAVEDVVVGVVVEVKQPVVEQPKAPAVVVEQPKAPEVVVEQPKAPEVIVEQPKAPAQPNAPAKPQPAAAAAAAAAPLPADPNTWDEDHVVQWVDSLGSKQFVGATFKDSLIDGEGLKDLELDDLADIAPKATKLAKKGFLKKVKKLFA